MDKSNTRTKPPCENVSASVVAEENNTQLGRLSNENVSRPIPERYNEMKRIWANATKAFPDKCGNAPVFDSSYFDKAPGGTRSTKRLNAFAEPFVPHFSIRQITTVYRDFPPSPPPSPTSFLPPIATFYNNNYKVQGQIKQQHIPFNHQQRNRVFSSNPRVHQVNQYYALSDCQEQFNDLKFELKIEELRKHCERDNLKTEELCYQFESIVLPVLISKLEQCKEKHRAYIEVDILNKIENCKKARNLEKKISNIFGAGEQTMENATETVTGALIELTRCLRICRTLLWASQIPLNDYPPRLGGYARHFLTPFSRRLTPV